MSRKLPNFEEDYDEENLPEMIREILRDHVATRDVGRIKQKNRRESRKIHHATSEDWDE